MAIVRIKINRLDNSGFLSEKISEASRKWIIGKCYDAEYSEETTKFYKFELGYIHIDDCTELDSNGFEYKEVNYIVRVPAGNYCHNPEYGMGGSICERFDNNGGHGFCSLFNTSMKRDEEYRAVKVDACLKMQDVS